MDLEQKLKELDALVEKMNGATLEEGLKLFEEGVKLTKECMAKLKEYKGKLTELLAEMDTVFND